MPTANAAKPLFATNEAGQPANGLGQLCDLLDGLRAEIGLLDAVGLHDVASRMEAYEKIVRRLVYASISDLSAPAG
jgi:hypothetical protein